MFSRSVVVVAAAAVGLWLWTAAPWADGNDRWKLVAAQKSLTHGEVVVTGVRDAWAFGRDTVGVRAWIPVVDGPHRPTAFHWDGERWEKSDLPVERGDIISVAASSPFNVWALAATGADVRVLHWNGDTWTIAERLPDTARRLAATAGHVWIFGDRRVWHHNGVAWSEQAVSFRASAVGARSTSDLWALDEDAPQVHHFDGETWTRTDLTSVLPKSPPPSDGSPPGPNPLRLTAVTADPSGVWITGEIGRSSFLLSRSGSRWRAEDTSTKAGRMIHDGPPVPDGEGGHWFLGSTDPNGHDSALAHRASSGRWTRVSVGGELTSLSTVPGGLLLATGTIGKASGVFRHLPPPLPEPEPDEHVTLSPA